MRIASAKGLSLVEMLVVVAIMATMASVAVMSTTAVFEQSRADATQRTIQGVADGILGPPLLRQPDGTFQVTGFVADIGRLPNALTDSDPNAEVQLSRRLKELWEPSGIPSFDVTPPHGDKTLNIPSGWRGPYVQLPIGESGLRDGWGKPLIAFPETATSFVTPPDASTLPYAAAILMSYGANGVFDASASGYDSDITSTLWKSSLPSQPARHLGELVITVDKLGASNATDSYNLLVRVYGPAEGVPKTISEYPPGWTVTRANLPVTFTVSQVPLGLKHIRAYLVVNSSTYPANPDVDIANVDSAAIRGAVKVVSVAGTVPVSITVP